MGRLAPLTFLLVWSLSNPGVARSKEVSGCFSQDVTVSENGDTAAGKWLRLDKVSPTDLKFSFSVTALNGGMCMAEGMAIRTPRHPSLYIFRGGLPSEDSLEECLVKIRAARNGVEITTEGACEDRFACGMKPQMNAVKVFFPWSSRGDCR